MSQEQQQGYLRFLSHNFANDEKWKQYESNLTFPANAKAAQLLAKYKLKFFAKNVDADCPDTPPTVPYEQFVIEPKTEHVGTLVFLHGLGDSGDGGWLDTWRMYQQRHLPGVKIILPSASSLRVSLNMGASMPAWYDLYGLDPSAREDSEGIETAKQYIHNLLITEMIQTGIPSDKIILGGFSQGGSIALYAGFSFPMKLAGVMGMSSFAVQRDRFEQMLQDPNNQNRQTSFFMCHGKSDPVVMHKFGKMSFDKIAQHLTGQKIWKDYPGLGHSANQEAMSDAISFIKSNL